MWLASRLKRDVTPKKTGLEILMRIRRFITVTAIVAACLASSVCYAADDKAGPKTVANEYFSMWIAGRTCEGVVKHWDIGRCFAWLFRSEYNTLSLSDRLYLQRIFTVFIVTSNENPAVRASLKGATIKLGSPEKKPQNRIRISGALTTKRGTTQVFVDLVRVDGSWKIVNVGHGVRGLEVLIAVWKQQKAAGGKDSVNLIEWWEMVLSQTLNARLQRPAGSAGQAGTGANRPVRSTSQPSRPKELSGSWVVQSVTKDGKAQGGNQGSHLIIRPDGTFLIDRRSRQSKGLWHIDADGRIVFVVGSKIVMQGAWRTDGKHLTVSFDDRGAKVKIKYLRENSKTKPKAPDKD